MNTRNYSESEFVGHFISYINGKNIFGHNTFYFEEVITQLGIPDVIMIKRDNYFDIKDLLVKYPPQVLINKNARLLSVMTKKYHTEDYIFRKSKLNYSTFRSALRILLKYSIILKNKNCLKLNEEFNIPKINFWSFEFKLKNWREALMQSLSYKTFSSFVVIIMPSNKESILIKNRKVFENFMIGSAIFSPEKQQVKFIVRPRKHQNITKSLYIDTLGRLALSSSVK